MPEFNHLKNEKSPYLKQHAQNPVDWYPWGKEAFREAERRDVPIFLSIGYSTCHWCHVMERESFTDQKTAALINKYFVAVKVDREERPDIDQLYMDVCRAMTGSGGWPLSIFMTADKRPFYAATYIPKNDKYKHRGLLSLLPQIYELWVSEREQLLNHSENVINHLKKEQTRSEENIELSQEIISKTKAILSRIYDQESAGFGSEPKFPMPHYLIFLLEQFNKSSEEGSLQMVEESLAAMRAGGIFDQLGGGFHRYATDRNWELPHFEKMLYDQALLIYIYAEAYRKTKKNIYLDTVKKTVSYLKREMQNQEGAFYSAEDADSEGAEGKFYFWDKNEISELLSEKEYQEFFRVFKDKDLKEITLSLSRAADFAELKEIKGRLFEERKKRIRPDKDKKILTDWNGLTAAALAKAGFVAGDQEYIELAEKTVNYIFNNLRNKDGSLVHSFHQGSFSDVDNLNDYAFLLWALIELQQATLKNEYLTKAEEIVKLMISRFWDQKAGGFYFTAAENNDLFLRQKKTEDSAVPSANSIACYNLLRLSHLLDDYDLRKKVEEMLSTFSAAAASAPASHIFMVLSYQYLKNPFKEINIYGSPDDQKVKKLLDYLRDNYKPELLLKIHPAAETESKAEFSLCRNFTCGEKTDKLDDIISKI